MKDPIDLTLDVAPGMRGVSVKTARTLADDGWNAADWTLYSHSGTHVDAPIHFGASPETIEQMPLDRFFGQAHVADLGQVAPSQILEVDDLGQLAESFPPGDCLLLRTGWSRHHADPSLYRDQLPRIGEELARWCVERRVKLVGVEPPSVANVNDLEEVTRIHRILLGAGITIVEGLCNLHLVKPGAFFIALPLKLSAGDGSPVRAIAFNPTNSTP